MTNPCRCVHRLKNPIQYYAWGSRYAIASFAGRDGPSPRPEAELWMGAHPKAPSRVLCNGDEVAFDQLIRRCPEEILGPAVVQRFGSELPFLFKLLAADAPLSIQAHPNREQARQGYERENLEGVPLDAPHRNYRDNNHKPEILCALTDFWGLNGFRPLPDLQQKLNGYCPKSLGMVFTTLQNASTHKTLQLLFRHMVSLQGQDLSRTIDEAVAQAQKNGRDEAVSHWLIELAGAYPGDIGILSPIILNLIHMKPGEAIYLPAGQLHAYLKGVGVELMANSDNVLRGGLTPKHIDREELMRVLRFEPTPPGMVEMQPVSAAETKFQTPAEEFTLSRIHLSQDVTHASPMQRNVEILFVTRGQLILALDNGDQQLQLTRGDSVLVPAAAGAYRLSGEAEIYRATVPPL